MDGSICTSFIHPRRSSRSRFGISKKLGILIRFLEWERSIYIKLGRACIKWHIERDKSIITFKLSSVSLKTHNHVWRLKYLCAFP
jgi:hypothetical protein